MKFDELGQVIKENVYYMPRDRQFGVADAFLLVPGIVYAFQATVSTDHPVSVSVLKAQMEFFGNRLIFAVPPKIHTSQLCTPALCSTQERVHKGI